MTQNRAAYYVTTPIYYVNDRPHIGHAYTTLACDVMARFKRLQGRNVTFLTGTDEHGQKVEKSAAAAGVDPQAFVDEVSQQFRDLTKTMNFSNDDFIRTTEPRHIRSAQAMWKRLEERGEIYLDSYAGWYSVRDEAFYAESELVEGKAPTGAPVEWVEEPSYFFRLSAWQERLLEYYEAHPSFIAPESRRNEVLSFVKGGLKDLSVSRTTFKWGIPVPGSDKHIMYVWLDALVNYLTAAGFPDQEGGAEWLWPADLHMVGKDILRFHAVYWPAFLMAAELPLPERVFAHGWWTNEGQKISKSLGNVIDPLELVETYGLDPVRYFLLREVPFGNDGNFARSALISRINSELANNIGNLVQRTLSMIAKNCEGKVPQPEALTQEETNFIYAKAAYDAIPQALDEQRFHEALGGIVEIGNQANLYIDEQAPWKLKKENPLRMQTVLYILAEHIRMIGILLQPFVPDSAAKILDQLAIDPEARLYTHMMQEHALRPGMELPSPQGIFPRFVEAA